jgi:hypothetical protein
MSGRSDRGPGRADGLSLSELARVHTRVALDVFATIAASNTASEAQRLTAATMLLNRGWGRIGPDRDGDGGDDPTPDLAETIAAARRRVAVYHDEKRAAAVEARRNCGCTACIAELIPPPEWD